MAEWLRLSTATPIRFLAMDSKTISVGNILGRDQKVAQNEVLVFQRVDFCQQVAKTWPSG